MAQLLHIGAGQHRLGDFEANRRVDISRIQQVGLRTNKRNQRHDQFFANRINRRVGHLGKQLLEVGVQRLVLVRQNGQGRIRSH